MSDDALRPFEARQKDGVMRGYEMGPQDRAIDLVFLHANGFNARTYRNMLAPLAADYRVLMLDMRGHGRTELPADPQALKNFHVYKNDVAAVMQAHCETPPVLAGHSLGGTAAILLGGEQTQIARHIVSFDPPVLPPWIGGLTGYGWAKSLFANFVGPYRASSQRRTSFASKEEAVEAYRLRRLFSGWPDQALRDYVEDGFAPCGDGVCLTCDRDWEAETYLAHKHDVLGAVRRMTCPLDLVLAEKGSPTPKTVALRVRLFKPKAGIVRIEGVGHLFPISHPDLAREPLRRALESEC